MWYTLVGGFFACQFDLFMFIGSAQIPIPGKE